MDKTETRARMKALRRSLSKEEISQRSAFVCDALLSLKCIKDAKTVMVYLSAFNEVDTAPIIKSLREKGVRIAVPVSNTDTFTITPSYIEGGLKKGAYGIMEPVVIDEARAEDIDVIIVPGVAFDRQCGRLGFGKGYYDRLLCGSGAYKIGICYDFQLVDKIDTDEHDVPMDIVICESEIIYGGNYAF